MDSQVIYKSGGFAFQLQPHWGKFPADMKGRAVCGITQGKDGLIYATTRSDKYPVAVFGADGNFLRGFGLDLNFRRTHGISCDTDGTLWCCDEASNLVYHLDTQGKVLGTMGKLDSFCDNGYDPTVAWPHDLYTISRAGEPFNRPTKVIRGTNGDLYASDGYGNTSIHRFDKDGNLLKTWGGPGKGPGKFRLPHSLWSDPHGNIWVADRENCQVHVFDEDGSFIKTFDRLGTPADIWGDGGNIFVIEISSGIVVFDLELNIVGHLGYFGSPLAAHTLGGDSNGNLYIGKLGSDDTLLKLERI